ncbi:MAG: hypothetical protein IKC06_06000 [Clostridia bacterium]|nr:hypothetical protein [Clostridia bacterium]
MKKIIIFVLCLLLTATLFGCRNTDDVEIYLAEIPIYGGYTGEPLSEFDLDTVKQSIDEGDYIADGEETKALSLLESKAVNKRIQKRFEEETNENCVVELERTVRFRLDSGEVAVLYTYIVHFYADSDNANLHRISRCIAVLVK